MFGIKPQEQAGDKGPKPPIDVSIGRKTAHMQPMLLVRLIRFIGHVLVVTFIVTATYAFFVIPNGYRAFAPQTFGLTRASERLFVDDIGSVASLRQLIEVADAETEGFFGPLATDPTWVICTTQTCADVLDLRASGLTYADLLLVIGPRGVNPRTMTHERVHAELHQYLDVTDALSPRFPAWFDEGLATHLSGDTRVTRFSDPRDADWILAAERYFDWIRIRRERTTRDRYGAAGTLVAEIEDKAGRDGLLELIRDVGENRADLMDLRTEILAQ